MRPGNAGVCVTVGQGVFPIRKPAKYGRMGIPLRKGQVAFIFRQLVQACPYLQHAALLTAVHSVGIFLHHLLRPLQVPVRCPAQDLQCHLVFCIQGTVIQAQQGLVQGILGRPDVFVFLQLFKVLFRD